MFSSRKAAPVSSEAEIAQLELEHNALSIKADAAKTRLLTASKAKAPPARTKELYRAFKSINEQAQAVENALMHIERAKGIAVVTNAQKTATRVINSMTRSAGLNDSATTNEGFLNAADDIEEAATNVLMTSPAYPGAEDIDIESEILALIGEEDAEPPEPVQTEQLPDTPQTIPTRTAIKGLRKIMIKE